MILLTWRNRIHHRRRSLTRFKQQRHIHDPSSDQILKKKKTHKQGSLERSAPVVWRREHAEVEDVTCTERKKKKEGIDADKGETRQERFEGRVEKERRHTSAASGWFKGTMWLVKKGSKSSVEKKKTAKKLTPHFASHAARTRCKPWNRFCLLELFQKLRFKLSKPTLVALQGWPMRRPK